MCYKSEQMYLKCAVIAHFKDAGGGKNYKLLTNCGGEIHGLHRTKRISRVFKILYATNARIKCVSNSCIRGNFFYSLGFNLQQFFSMIHALRSFKLFLPT